MSETTSTSGADSAVGIGINSPGLTPKGTQRNRAFKNTGEAAAVFTRLQNDNSDRNLRNGRIMAKYNAERPWTQNQLETEGLGWKSNFSTKVLSTLIDRVAPRITKVIASLKYFTSSALPNNVPGATAKTEAFQQGITDLVRSWPEWNNFIAQVTMEDSLFGYTCAARTSEYTWRPKHFRQDAFFVPTGTKQRSELSQIICLKEQLLPHELFELISNPEAAEAAGWNLANVYAAINNAMPELQRSKSTDNIRLFQDLLRENSVGTSYNGAKTVALGHIFAQELDGKVSHYIINTRAAGTGGDELFVREDRFNSMTDVASFFSFQEANGTLHGSKGIGREVYQVSQVLERARNEAVDRLQLAGKLVVQGEEGHLRRYKAHVIGNAMLIDTKFTISTQKIDGDVEPFFKLDAYMRQILDEIAGNISPRQLPPSDRRTKAEVDLVAAREEEGKDAVIERFLTQFSVMITAIQKWAMDPKCEDEDAQTLRKKLLGLMRAEELQQLVDKPSAMVVRDLSDTQRQQVVIICTENRGNPLYNQMALEREKITSVLGSEYADKLILPVNDPTEEAEQARLQQLELLALLQGQPVPVSPRDNHVIHCTLLQPVVDSGMKILGSNPAARQGLDSVLEHMLGHIQIATEAKDPNQNVTGFAAFVAGIKQRLMALDAHDKAMVDAAAAGVPAELAANAGATAGQAALGTAVPPGGASDAGAPASVAAPVA